MDGEGRESGGAGSARMSMESRLTPQPGGLTEVVVVSDVEVVGRLVQLGRGMIEQVSHQVFLQFAEQVRATLEAEAAAARGGAGAARGPAAGPGRGGGGPAAAPQGAAGLAAVAVRPRGAAPLRVSASRSRLSRLCTGRCSSTWGRMARTPAARGWKPS